jgi:L,D-peptidoglycan transpeptidase YkuD (ErfK/YbiS/YcfS/YnhG family)
LPAQKTIAVLCVRSLSATALKGHVEAGNLRFPCALGRSGMKARKREGDGATPMGLWPVRKVLYRTDRVKRPRTAIPVQPLRRDDGWCDAAVDGNYNRFVRHPYRASAERLWRADGLYDLILILGYNDHPRMRGRGSAIFLHVARRDHGPTEGCVALHREHVIRLLERLGAATKICIGRQDAKKRPELSPRAS